MIVAEGLTDTGRKRRENEDRILVDRTHLIFAVADGIGGARCGERAAELATQTLAEYFQTRLPELNNPDRMRTAIQAANERILKESSIARECSGMGSTVSAVKIDADSATVGSLGDSRVYLLRDGKLVQSTQDDSLLEKLVASGAITPEEARSHPMRNVLTQSLGAKDPIKIQILEFNLRPGDRLLLSSDGLHGTVSPEAMRDVLMSATEPDEAVHRLVAAAREAGGPDNISCIVIDCRE